MSSNGLSQVRRLVHYLLNRRNCTKRGMSGETYHRYKHVQSNGYIHGQTHLDGQGRQIRPRRSKDLYRILKSGNFKILYLTSTLSLLPCNISILYVKEEYQLYLKLRFPFTLNANK